MNKNQILDKAYRNPQFDDVIRNICRSKPHYFDDVKQEAFEWLLKKPDDLIHHLHESNKLIAYFTRIVHTQVTSSTSRFHYLYRKNDLVSTDDMSSVQQFDDEPAGIDFDIVNYVQTERLLTWYEYELFNLYYRIHPSFLEEDIQVKMSCRKIGELVGIRYRRIFDHLTQIRVKIFRSIIANAEISNDIPFERLEFMQDFVDKNSKEKVIY